MLSIIATAALLASPVSGKISPKPRSQGSNSAAATAVAKAMAAKPSVIRTSYFPFIPPRGKTAAVSSTGMAGFPRSGKTFAILSNGNVLSTHKKNNSTSTGTRNGGQQMRGARDVTMLQLRFRAARNVNCVSFRFRFLTEEFPEFVGEDYNDFFIAELDRSTWRASSNDDPKIIAPDNFAFDDLGNKISVNATGVAKMTAKNAKGTTYDGATRILRASTPVTPGTHSLFLTIADQGDRIYDSAVFLDRLTLNRRANCTPGAVYEGK